MCEPWMSLSNSSSRARSISMAEQWQTVRRHVGQGELDHAASLLEGMSQQPAESHETVDILNGLACVLAASGHEFQAVAACELALRVDPENSQVNHTFQQLNAGANLPPIFRRNSDRPLRIAIVSLLFNWPSTGGGTVHTYELAQFLERAGFTLCHIFAQYADWQVGNVAGDYGVSHMAVPFAESEWNAPTIRRRIRETVDRFDPDMVIVTDSWNCKPLLAEAVQGYPYLLRIAAMETLCPLNNVRMLVDAEGTATSCPKDQLSDPAHCRQCVATNKNLSGSLHRAERDLAGFDEPDYPHRLQQAIAAAHAVFVVNPIIADLVAPHSRCVRVVPSGFDVTRFTTSLISGIRSGAKKPLQILFAGLADEFMKGFHILQEAGAVLWSRRQDFEIVATSDPVGRLNDFTRLMGWQSQADLPRAIADADILVFPTLAEEALGRSAVEGMACGRPVVASRIGGLKWVVEHNRTGLLHEPGDVAGLVAALEQLLDDEPLRQRLGLAGRKKFESDLTWEVILDRHYFPLLSPSLSEVCRS
ncbi:MAG: glycosyltransferase family 1 protein [Planctomycetota bacterium]|nr:MAG: glycosyltransferase family 1 protein [Planctomycetota bacterium]